MKKDVVGNKYGYWKVLQEVEPKGYSAKSRGRIGKQRRVLCECDCELHTRRVVTLACLRNGSCNSCGCAEHENRSKGRKAAFNRYEICGDVTKIYLDDSDEFTLIDTINLSKVTDGHIGKESTSGYWYYSNCKRHIRLHVLLFGQNYDHINRDKSNNTISNVRCCTHQENTRNRGVCKNNKIGYKGVSKTDEKYSAFISVNATTLYLGRWATPEDAAHAYDIAAHLLFKDFAFYNFPERMQHPDKSIVSTVTIKIMSKHPEWLDEGDVEL